MQLTDRVHCWLGSVNLGLVEGRGGALVLIDSGLDAASARKLLRPFVEQGKHLAAVINTHCHADHVGGNADLVRTWAAEVHAPAPDHLAIQYPDLFAASLYGGALPPPSMRVKLLLARASPVTGVLIPDRPAELAGVTLLPVPLPGHSPGQVGIAVDDVLFAGDAVFGNGVLAKHPIPYMIDVAAALDSVDRLGRRPERWVVPGHGRPLLRQGPADGLLETLAAYRRCITAITATVWDALAEPADTEQVLAAVARGAGKVHDNDPSYHLDRTTVLAHLAYLAAARRVEPIFLDGRRLWRRR